MLTIYSRALISYKKKKQQHKKDQITNVSINSNKVNIIEKKRNQWAWLFSCGNENICQKAIYIQGLDQAYLTQIFKRLL